MGEHGLQKALGALWCRMLVPVAVMGLSSPYRTAPQYERRVTHTEIKAVYDVPFISTLNSKRD
jgi:hypothetical protein